MSTKVAPSEKNKNEITTEAKPKKRTKVKEVAHEFLAFLREYSVVGIAMGLVIGAAVNTFVQSIVSGLITPFIQLIVPSGVLKDMNYEVNGVTFKIGPIIDSAINFIIVAFLFFLFVKLVFKAEKVDKTYFK